jgi:DNA (cytosine-5)-methyltransferase 1
MGVANGAPEKGWRAPEGVPGPKLTTAMVARIQGWHDIEPPEGSDSPAEGEFRWRFHGRKTSVYRQIGNAFPPPVAKALGVAIRKAIRQEGERQTLVENTDRVLDPVYKLLRGNARPLTIDQIIEKLAKTGTLLEQPDVERRLNHLGHDFTVTMTARSSGVIAYSLGEFKAFTGQDDHQRHHLFTQHRAKIS